MSLLALPVSVSGPATAEFLSLFWKRTIAQAQRTTRTLSASSRVPSPSACSPPITASSTTPFGEAFRTQPQLVNRTRKSRSFAARSESAPGNMEVLVKSAVGEPDRLGDCPFSQRVLLTLEEKAIPYYARYVNLTNKPQWFLDINPGGKVPVLKVNNEWVPDSDVITEILERDHPVPSLKVSEANAGVGSSIFGAFIRFLKSKDPSNDGTEAAVVAELKALDSHLAAKGPYVDGDKITSVDLALAPKLYHLRIALGHFKKFSIPTELTSLLKYIELLESRESFKKTSASPDLVIKGWAAHEGVA